MKRFLLLILSIGIYSVLGLLLSNYFVTSAYAKVCPLGQGDVTVGHNFCTYGTSVEYPTELFKCEDDPTGTNGKVTFVKSCPGECKETVARPDSTADCLATPTPTPIAGGGSGCTLTAVAPTVFIESGHATCVTSGSQSIYVSCTNGSTSQVVCNAGATQSTCVSTGAGSAACATPTPSSIPTGTPTATPTPTPATGVTCSDGKKAGDIYSAGIAGWVSCYVKRCGNDGLSETLGTCTGICKDDLPAGEPTENICTGTYARIEVDPRCVVDQKKGQYFPTRGYNCGIPKGDKVPRFNNATGVYDQVTDDNDAAHMCCYSVLAHADPPPLSCYIGTNFSLVDKVMDWAQDRLLGLIKRLPLIFLPENQNPGLSAMQKLSDQIPACNDGSGPADGKAPGDPGCICQHNNANITETGLSKLCESISTDANDKERKECEKCVAVTTSQVETTVGLGETTTATVSSQGVWTAIGCIGVNSTNDFIQSLFRIGISLGGAFALLCNIYGAFLYQTSRGSPEQLKKSQDLITSCITGLLLLIFSVFILRLIGYNILRIPGFG